MRRVLVVLSVLFAVLPMAASAEPGRPDQPALPVGGPVFFKPANDTVLEIAGRGAYRGTIEVRQSGSGLTIVDDVDIESYLMGLAEVPASWPANALKAQAVAARTYALWERENGAWRKSGFDVCATTTCQVYAGVSSEKRENGKRWVDAVRETRGEVLLYRGKPALTRYHASSGGQTLPNETVFPKQGKLPYLKGVRDPADRASPLHSWTVRFSPEQMTVILRSGLGIDGDLQEIVADEDARTVTVRTSTGEHTFTAPRFRERVSKTTPKLFADVFPGTRPDGKPMPETLPSSRFSVSSGDSGFEVTGRGYGHGVGLSQWGAKGRADRGDDYKQILTAYYAGLTVSHWPGSAALRVGIARGQSAATVSGSGTFSVSSGKDTLASSTIGRWTVTRGAGRALALRPPDGYSLPLVLSGVRVPRRLVLTRDQVDPAVQISFVLPKAARVDAVVARGGRVAARGGNVYESGENRVRAEISDPAKLDARATYEVRLTAFDGEARATASSTVVIERAGFDSSMPLRIGLLLALLAVVSIMWRRRSRHTAQRTVAPSADPHATLARQ